MKKIITKIGSILLIPVIIIVVCMYIFEDFFSNFTWIVYARYVLRGIAAIGILGAIIELIDEKKK